MLTKMFWKSYLEDPELEFDINKLITGNLIVLITPITLIFDLFFIIPEVIIYRKGKHGRTR